jgi:hypothetical protein
MIDVGVMNDAKWACHIIFDNLIPTQHISIASKKHLPQNWQKKFTFIMFHSKNPIMHMVYKSNIT